MKKIKKILVVGYFNFDPNIYTYATSFYKTFQDLGYKVAYFNCKKPGSFFSNYILNLDLLRRVADFSPDLIFFIKSNNISYKITKRLKEKFNAFLVNFYPDNPFTFWNGNSNKNVLNSLPFYDCFLIWSKMLIPALESAGCKKVYYFPFAFDQNLFSKDIFITVEDKKRYSSEVCFVGTWDCDREKWLTALCKKIPNLNLFIWGNLWKKKLSLDSILRCKLQGGAIYNNEMRTSFKCSKIILNFIRKQNMTSHNMRTFEVPASGAFLLTERTVEQANFLFKENENIACFGDINELVEKIDFYLKNDGLRYTVANNGKQRALQFTIQVLLSKFMDDFRNLNKKDDKDELNNIKTKNRYFDHP